MTAGFARRAATSQLQALSRAVVDAVPTGGGGLCEPRDSPSGGNQADEGATASTSVGARTARRLDDLSPTEQTVIFMAIVDVNEVADGCIAALFAACEVRAHARPRGKPPRADLASTGGSSLYMAAQQCAVLGAMLLTQLALALPDSLFCRSMRSLSHTSSVVVHHPKHGSYDLCRPGPWPPALLATAC